MLSLFFFFLKLVVTNLEREREREREEGKKYASAEGLPAAVTKLLNHKT